MADEGTQLGKYVLKRKLATGGMAEIWLSEQRGPGGFAKELVIKRILPHLADDAKFVEMFLDEARLAAQLHHPNIVQIYDLGEASGSYFIAMEYIRGNDLEQLVDQAEGVGGHVDPHVAARIVADACGALDYAHTFTDPAGTCLNLVHRDISPQNILVDIQGVVKLVDFGVAKAASSTHKTQTGAVKGKFAYMSPEQIKGRQLDGRSDLFAMGIVLFELLTGVRPFGHDSEMMAVAAILDHPAPKPSEIYKSVPKGLDQIVLKALEKEPNNRFVSAEAMQVELETFLKKSGKPIGTKDTKSYMISLFGEQLSTRPIPARRPVDAMAATELEEPGMPPPYGPAPPPPQGLYSRETRPRVADPKGVPTERGEPTTSGGVGAGLIAALLFVFLALVGAGIFLYTTLTADEPRNDPVAEADAGQAGDVADAVASIDDAGSQLQVSDVAIAVQSDAGVESRQDMEVVVQVVPDGGLIPDLPLMTDVGIDLAAAQVIPTDKDAGTDPPVDAGALVQLIPAAEDAGPELTDDAVVAVAEDAGQAPVTTDAAFVEDAAAQVVVAAEEDVEEDPTEVAVAVEEDVEEDPTETVVAVEEDVEEERPHRDRGRDRSNRPGTIRFRVTPRGRYEISVDGRRVGRTPSVPPQERPPGRYTIEARRISDGETRTERIRLEPGETEMVRFEF